MYALTIVISYLKASVKQKRTPTAFAVGGGDTIKASRNHGSDFSAGKAFDIADLVKGRN